jgi:hypothetical protein
MRKALRILRKEVEIPALPFRGENWEVDKEKRKALWKAEKEEEERRDWDKSKI